MSTRRLFWDVDTQVDFMRESGALYVPDAESIRGQLGRLTSAARTLRIPVVASACDHEPHDDEISGEPDFAETYPPHCLRGTPGAEKIAETNLPWTLELRSDPVDEESLRRFTAADHPTALLHKKHFDVFTNPNAETLLTALDPEEVVVYGVALDVCNRAAIEGMLARGRHRITALTDATRPIHADAATDLWAAWSRRGVELRSTDDLLAELALPI